jgi:Holliday junction resolvasome RuvABC endonuclease subunit
MKATTLNPRRVLAIDPTTRGFGFVVLESTCTLVDWGGKVIRKQNETTTLEKLSKLIAHYRPEVLVFEDHKGSRRCARVRKLLDAVGRLVAIEGLRSRCIAVSHMKRVFGVFRAKTKHEIAVVVSQQLPDLAPQLPRYRKAWMSEGSQMAVFDAAALALTYFYSQSLRRCVVPAVLLVEPSVPSTGDSKK